MFTLTVSPGILASQNQELWIIWKRFPSFLNWSDTPLCLGKIKFLSLAIGLDARYSMPADGNRWSVNHMKGGKLPTGASPATYALSERSLRKVQDTGAPEEAATAEVNTWNSKGRNHHKRGTRRSEACMANTHIFRYCCTYEDQVL